MENKFWLKPYIFAFLILCISSPTQAFYKKKVLIGPFKNPAKWDKSYDPGKIIADLLVQELTHKNRVQLVSISKNMMKLMGKHGNSPESYNLEPAVYETWEMDLPGIVSIQGPNPKMMKPMQKMDPMEKTEKIIDPPWPVDKTRLPMKPALVEIRGTIIKFLPATAKESVMKSDPMKSFKKENAELRVQIELIQNKTGRTIFQKTFEAFSSQGSRPFALEMLNTAMKHKNHKPSSIKLAMNHLNREMVAYITEKIDSILLEGEIIEINKKKIALEMAENKILFLKMNQKKDIHEEVLINLGTINGVGIGDIFEVHAMSLGLQDPYLAIDLGDIYVQTGAIKIVHAWDGFSKAISLGGENYKKGYLVRSISTLSGKNSADFGEEKAAWWEFHGNHTVN